MALAKAGFTIGVKPISVLRPHEETIPEHVRGLEKDMRLDGVQKDPIIIDRDSATVLDGMHRLAAFDALGVQSAVCCAVDYSASAVSVGRWARVYALPKGSEVPRALGQTRATKKLTVGEALRALEGKDEGFAVFADGAAFLPGERVDLAGAIEAIEGLDDLAAASGWTRSFVPEDDVDVPLQSERNLVALVRRLGKEDVVSAGRTGRLFPCKTSMHRIDPRPVAVNFPLDSLDRDTNSTLIQALSGREGRILPSNSTYEGRRYKERLLVLDEG